MSTKVNYWSSADIKILKKKLGKAPVKKIARELKRSESATRQKAYAMGISTAAA